MNQKEFSKSLGVTQSGVSYMEQDGRNVSNMTIKGICSHFKGNEDWLRNGKDPIYKQEPTFSLDKFVKDYDRIDLEVEAMKAYFELDLNIRKTLVKHFKERLNTVLDKLAEPTMTVEEAEAAYIKSRLEIAQQTTAKSDTLKQEDIS